VVFSFPDEVIAVILGIHPFPKTPPKKKLSLKNPYLEG
jgi:hypothetical protein